MDVSSLFGLSGVHGARPCHAAGQANSMSNKRCALRSKYFRQRGYTATSIVELIESPSDVAQAILAFSPLTPLAQ